MNQDTSDLLDSVRNDPSTRPPFFWHHVRPERQRWAIMEIWRNAGPLTRPLFDRGATDGEHGPNWVAGWLLYSVFRSRDVRNNRNRRKGESSSAAAAAATSGGTYDTSTFVESLNILLMLFGHDSGTDLSKRSKSSGEQQPSPVRIGFYDPVRNG